MHKFTIVGRGSWLSLAQIKLFRSKVLKLFPEIEFEVIIKKTAGDREQSTPLHLVEGKDFFTAEIQEALRNGEADFAVHSMKDVSSENFFTGSHYSIFDRNNPRDAAIFNPQVIRKIILGQEIIIGTSSPRRSSMATDFLAKALPKLTLNPIRIKAVPIRGNVDVRLGKLNNNEYDGVILAAAGLNRLLQFEPSKATIKQLLKGKKQMLLPLFECPPAAGQGAIVAETNRDNKAAIEILEAIRQHDLDETIRRERIYAQQYGYGCSQAFGVFHIPSVANGFTYAAGSSQGNSFTEWDLNIPVDPNGKNIFRATDFMADFFTYQFNDTVSLLKEAVFVASHKAAQPQVITEILRSRRVFAAGTRTWLALAKKGLWVEGCADGLGLEFFEQTLNSNLVDLSKNTIQILTNTESAADWSTDGWHTAGSYTLIPNLSEELINAVSKADLVYWTSFKQYELCKPFLKKEVQHACPDGRTTRLFQQEGITPLLFPGIQSFNQWEQQHTTLTAEG
jgi:hydroxymethylbilane synthase